MFLKVLAMKTMKQKIPIGLTRRAHGLNVLDLALSAQKTEL